MANTQRKLVKVPTASELVKEYGSKSGAIRYLHSQGWSRSEIAEHMGLRYQHGRTVLITPLTSDK
jgi:hypothetical protein